MSDASVNTISFILPPPPILTHLLSEFLYLVDNLLSTISCEEDIPINMRTSPSGERGGGRRREKEGGGGRRREEEEEGGAGEEGDREWSVILPSLIPRSCPPSVMKKKWEGLVYHVSVDCVWTHCMGAREGGEGRRSVQSVR